MSRRATVSALCAVHGALAASFCACRHRSQSQPSVHRIRVPVGGLGSTAATLRIGLVADLVQLLKSPRAAQGAARARASGERRAASHCILRPLAERRLSPRPEVLVHHSDRSAGLACRVSASVADPPSQRWISDNA